MAISKIKKIELIGLDKDKQELLGFLQGEGMIELIRIKNDALADMAISDTRLLELEEAILYLSSFQEKGGLLDGMVKLKPMVNQQEFKKVINGFDYQDTLKDLVNARNNLKGLIQQKEKMSQEASVLIDWKKLNIPLDQIQPTDNCGIMLGTVSARDYDNLKEELSSSNIYITTEIIKQDEIKINLVLIYLLDDFKRLEEVLKNLRFNFVSLPRHKMTARERLFEINGEIMIVDDEISDVKKNIEIISGSRFKLMVIYDYLLNLDRRKGAENNLNRQRFTFALSGWIRQADLACFKEKIMQRFRDLEIFISDPRQDDDIPTAFENQPIIRPFEAVTNLYGQPIYKGIDPSGLLAPFFAISFGFCMMDAGYGLVLLILMMFYMAKKQISAHGRNLLRLFLFMSISTIFAGIITGSFFADIISRLPDQFNMLKSIQRRFVLFDPVKDSLLFLGITLVMGYIQIWTGVFVKFLKDLRRDKMSAFILDLPTLLIQTSLLMLVLVFAKALPGFMMKVSGLLLVISCLFVIYYQWKTNPDIGQKIFWSIFGIYSIITGNFLADTLSFSRIFALGITGGLLGMAINEILLPKAFPSDLTGFLTAALALLIWPVVQGIILAINLLGAYVQTSRLQYLEFFTKFFESGGRPFRPFKEETKYIFLAEEQ